MENKYRAKYNSDRVEIICDSLKLFKGRVQACKDAGIVYSTFLNWLDAKPEFLEAIKKAELEGMTKVKGAMLIQIISHTHKHWQAAAWMLERLFPEEFSLKRLENSETLDDILKAMKDAIKEDDMTGKILESHNDAKEC